jgi:hypothetical protein
MGAGYIDRSLSGICLSSKGRAGVWVAAWMAVAISLPVSVSPAAVVQALTIEQLAAEAALICTCRMTGQRSDWDVERSMLVTYVALSVEESYKGEGDSAVEVELFSGLGHEQLNLFSGAVFEQGEQAVLFLKPSGTSTASAPRYHLVGWAQGKFTVRSDPKNGEEWVERNLYFIVRSRGGGGA